MREADIRPPEAYASLLSAARQAAVDMGMPPVPVPCPACGWAGTSPVAFFRDEYSYAECGQCGSLYADSRPTADALAQFYWRLDAFGDFYGASAEARLRDIVLPRAHRIVQASMRHGVRGTFCDIGCGPGHLLAAVEGLRWFNGHFGIEPSSATADAARILGFAVAPYALEEGPLRQEADFAAAFEVLEHVFSPKAFLESARALLVPGGLLMLTTLTCDGWDIGELWERHPSVCPPLHLNLLSMQGLRDLMARTGLELLDISTPGRLDADIVRNAMAARPDASVSRFARRLSSAPQETLDAFQDFLRAHRMSSHVEILARRPA